VQRVGILSNRGFSGLRTRGRHQVYLPVQRVGILSNRGSSYWECVCRKSALRCIGSRVPSYNICSSLQGSTSLLEHFLSGSSQVGRATAATERRWRLGTVTIADDDTSKRRRLLPVAEHYGRDWRRRPCVRRAGGHLSGVTAGQRSGARHGARLAAAAGVSGGVATSGWVAWLAGLERVRLAYLGGARRVRRRGVALDDRGAVLGDRIAYRGA